MDPKELLKQQQAEEASRRSEERFRALIENTNDVITILDRTGVILYESPSVERVWGYTPEELLGKNVLDLVHPDDRERVLAVFAQVVQKPGHSARCEFRFQRKDGSWWIVESIGKNLLGSQGVDGIVVYSKDVTERQQTEEALRASEQRYRRLLASTTDYIYSVTIRDGRAVDTKHGAACVAVTGYTTEEYEADPHLWFRMVHEGDREAVRQQAAQALVGEQTPPLEHRIVHKNGSVRWIRNTTVLRKDNNGKLVGYDGLIGDITERKLAETALVESERKYRALVEQSSDAILTADDHWNVKFANSAACEMLGYTQEEFQQLNVEDTYVPEERDMVAGRKQEMRNGLALRFERNVLRKNGTRFPAEIIVGRVEGGQHQAIMRDITERKRAEENLQLQSTALQAAANGIFITDRNGTILWVNPAFTTLTGYTPEEAIGQNPRLLKSGKQGEQHYADLWKTITSGQVWRGEIINRRKDGTLYTEEMTVTPVRSAAGEITRFIAIKQDVTARKRAEEALRESEAKFRSYIEHAPHAILAADGQGRLVDFNPAALELLGCDATTLAGMRIPDMHAEEDRETVLRDFATLTDTGHSGGEYRLKRRDGSFVWTSLRAVRVTDNRFMAFIQDITERKRAEEALRRMAAIIESSDDAIISKTLEGTITSWNRGAEKLFGYSAPEVVGRPMLLLIPPERANEELGILQRIGRGESVDHFETVRVRKGGEQIDVSVTISPIKDGHDRIIGASKIARDITERKRTEEALREAEAKYRALVEQSLAGVYLFTKDGFQYSNEALAHIFGYEPHEIIGKLAPADLTQPEDRPIVAANIRKRLAGEIRDIRYSFRGRRKDGSTVYCEVNGRRIDYEGRPAILGTLVDGTERKCAEDALRESNRRLENALAELKDTQQQVIQQERLGALGTMASGIAHDFNNALAAILGFSELLLYRPDCLNDREKARRYIEMMNTAAKDAGDVVNRLREFYRHREEGEVFVAVDINRLVEEAASLTEPKWKAQAEASGVSITVQKDLQKIPTVAGNAANLREMLTNLIFNAVDAMPQGGTITIRTRRDNSHAVLEVADTGTGMTEEVRRRCLEPFFTTKGERGTGLGLSMVYGIVQRHEGEIDIHTEVGKGTTFVIRLPHHAAQLQQPPERDDRPASHAPSLRVLLVDDEPLTRKVIGEYLKFDGHTVEMADNGGDGLEKFRDGPFDLVVVDRAMPDMNGDQVASIIKSVSPATPIIMLTGFGSMMEAVDEKPASVDLVVGKPVTIADLRAAVTKATTLASADFSGVVLREPFP